VNLTITYHSGATEEWGSSFKENGGRIICEFTDQNWSLQYLIAQIDES